VLDLSPDDYDNWWTILAADLSLLLILEMNGKYSIYDSQPDKAWIPSNATLVCWKHHNTFIW
jgi:hypothetical protein